MPHGRQDCPQPNILHMRTCPELQSVKTHRHAPGYAAVHGAGRKVGDFEGPIVDLIAAAAGESGRMELRIWQGDVLPGITPAALESAAGELAFSAQIDPPRPPFSLSEGFPEIQQVDPAPVTERSEEHTSELQ